MQSNSSISTIGVAGGTYYVTAKISDTSGLTRYAYAPNPVTIVASGDSSPTVSLTNPAQGASVSGTVTVTADASDDHGVTKVEFFVAGSKVGEDTDPTGGWSWSWDTTATPNGSFVVTATATDTMGQTASDTVQVTVDNLPPTVTSYSLIGDTGVSSNDQITSDTTPLLTFAFSEAVYGSAGGVTVTKPGGGAVPPADYSVGGLGTGTLIVTFAPPLTDQGQYTVALSGIAITDAAGNPLNGNEVRHFTIDTGVPTADIVDVTPDPRVAGVDTISIVFSEPVYGFDLADLSLTRNGVNVALTAATLTTTDNVTWTLGNLTSLTGTLAGNAATTYDLTVTAAGSRITDVAGNPLTADASDVWVLSPPSTFTGTPNADTFEFIAAGAVGGLPTMHQLKLTLAGSPVVTYLYDASGSVVLTLRGEGGNDTLKITGGPGMDTSNIYRYAILHVGPAAAGSAGYYSVYAPIAGGSFTTMVVDAGAGTGQRATLYNGPASGDHFTASSWLRTGSMVGTGTGNVYNNSVKNFDQISAPPPAAGPTPAPTSPTPTGTTSSSARRRAPMPIA